MLQYRNTRDVKQKNEVNKQIQYKTQYNILNALAVKVWLFFQQVQADQSLQTQAKTEEKLSSEMTIWMKKTISTTCNEHKYHQQPNCPSFTSSHKLDFGRLR